MLAVAERAEPGVEWRQGDAASLPFEDASFDVVVRAELAELVAAAGIPGAEIALHEGSVRFPSVKELVRVEVKGSPLADRIGDQAMEDLAAESERALAEFVVASDEVVMPIDAHIVTARKP